MEKLKETTPKRKCLFKDEPYKYKHEHECKGKKTIIESDKENAPLTKANTMMAP
jgi:hypothetical protein